MIGFEVTLNEKTYFTAKESGVASVILFRMKDEKRDEMELCVNNSIFELTNGDKIIVKVKDIEISLLKIATIEPSVEDVAQNKLEYYYSLKDRLEKEGLI